MSGRRQKMAYVPWRLKNFLSEHFPLLYHVAVNLGETGNSPEHWDRRLAETWADPIRYWPTKNDLVASLTRPTDVILDIGCGNGSILRSLKGRGYLHLHGLDISDYAVRHLSTEGIRMHAGVLPSVPLADASCDVVIASQVLEHVIRRHRLLRNIRRVLKPGGRALVFVPDDCLGPIDEPEHVIKYNERSLRKLLEKHFAVVELNSMRDANHPMSLLFAHVTRPAG